MDSCQAIGQYSDEPGSILKSIANANPADWYREAIFSLEQTIDAINSPNLDHLFAQFHLDKVVSLVKVGEIVFMFDRLVVYL